MHDFVRREAPNLEPYLESGMLAYGRRYHHKYGSGREGDWCLLGLAARKAYVSPYFTASDGETYVAETHKERLPKADIGRSCGA